MIKSVHEKVETCLNGSFAVDTGIFGLFFEWDMILLIIDGIPFYLHQSKEMEEHLTSLSKNLQDLLVEGIGPSNINLEYGKN